MSNSKPGEQKGLIFNIQRYSIKDGPGIRTTVFMKGCPLRCLWCSNPESQNTHPEILTHDIKCVRCGRCEQVCPTGAITVDEEARKINRAKCNLCLKCAEACLYGAITVSGEYKTVDEVVKEAESDRVFYEHSGGGVTVSGGEALCQIDFVYQLLKACKQKGLHTTLDTSGYGPWDDLEKLLEYTDLVLYDIKHIDPEQHKKGTGVDNSSILDNARKIAARGVKMWLRVPLIPGYNDSKEDIEKTVRFGIEIGVEKISLLPYHEWGKSKYDGLGRNYPFESILALSDEYVESLKELVESFGVKAEISG
ncbi:glycyl-radical enzyme activating protein [Chloroflexota bacterium]